MDGGGGREAAGEGEVFMLLSPYKRVRGGGISSDHEVESWILPVSTLISD